MCSVSRNSRACSPPRNRRSISLLIAMEGRIRSSPMQTPTPITREKQRCGGDHAGRARRAFRRTRKITGCLGFDAQSVDGRATRAARERATAAASPSSRSAGRSRLAARLTWPRSPASYGDWWTGSTRFQRRSGKRALASPRRSRWPRSCVPAGLEGADDREADRAAPDHHRYVNACDLAALHGVPADHPDRLAARQVRRSALGTGSISDSSDDDLLA